MRNPSAAVTMFSCAILVACSGSGSGNGSTGGGTGASSAAGSTGAAGSGGATGSAGASGATGRGGASGSTGASGATSRGGASGAMGSAGAAGTSGTTANMTKGWLYTSGNKIYVSNGSAAGSAWMGRGVNVDDIFLCGNNSTLGSPTPDKTFEAEISGLVAAWKPNFLRVSLSMASYQTTASWLTEDARYKTPMTNAINAIGAYSNIYVLVTLRSDASMIEQDTGDGDPEATGIPSDSSNTPDKTKFPTGTDAVYTALVDSFANDGFVLFGITNEAGGNKVSDDKIVAAMSHAVTTIRSEEDRLHVPHHLVSVQGNSWTSDISAYGKKPLSQDNVVYEVHGYPPSTKSYTYANLPVIIGEYGSLDTGTETAFYQDLETKQIPNLAWDFDAFSDCSPDLLEVTGDATQLKPSAWGKVVQAYLSAHASP